MPFFQTFSADSSHPGTCNPSNSARSCSMSMPASSSAPSVMSPLMPEKQSKYASFMGVRRRAVLSGPQEKCPTGAFRYYRRRCGVSNLGGRRRPLPLTFPDLCNLKDLEDTAIGSAHSNGVTNLADKVTNSQGMQRQAGEVAGANSPNKRIAEAHVLVKNLIFW